MPTKRFSFKRNNAPYLLVVNYGLVGHPADKYFSITGTIWHSRRLHCCGCIHGDIVEIAPEFQPYIKWHLTHLDSGPMHYEANALYFWEQGKEKRDSFNHVVVFGAIEEKPLADNATIAEVREWLRERLPRLMEKFHSDMRELFGESYESELKE